MECKNSAASAAANNGIDGDAITLAGLYDFCGKLEPVSRFELASVDRVLLRLLSGSSGTSSPAQVEIRPKREDHGSAINLRFEACSFVSRWKGECKCPAKNNRIKAITR